MSEDPIVAELERMRAEHAAQFNYDVRAIGEDLRRRQRESGRTYVTLPPRRIEPPEKPSIPPIDTDTPIDISPNVES